MLLLARAGASRKLNVRSARKMVYLTEGNVLLEGGSSAGYVGFVGIIRAATSRRSVRIREHGHCARELHLAHHVLHRFIKVAKVLNGRGKARHTPVHINAQRVR